MTSINSLSRRLRRFGIPVAAILAMGLAGCDAANSLDPVSDQLTPEAPALDSLVPASIEGPSLATAYRGGIPFGTFDLPNSWFGSRYDGAMRIIGPSPLMSDLRAIKSRGGRVIVNFSGGRSRYQDAAGNFSFTKWKASVNRFRNINFSSYIKDGTIVAHYLVDEPHNKSKWNGKAISQSTLDAMAKYSKQLWPGLATVVRAYPNYLADWSGTYHYLDAGWLQYVHRFGDVGSFLSKEVSLAKRKDLALVVGLNVLRGGPRNSKMTASQIKSWGSTLLNSSYPCAFISWEYNSTYLNKSSIRDAMSYLHRKAKDRSSKSCRS